jgi:hypothetical protein
MDIFITRCFLPRITSKITNISFMPFFFDVKQDERLFN